MRAMRGDSGKADRRRAKPYNTMSEFSIYWPGQWLGGAYLVKAAPREYEGERHCRQVQRRRDMRGAAIYRPENLDPKKEGKMKLLRIAAVVALTASGGIFANAGNAAPAAGLLTGALTVRTLATPAPEASVEKTYYHRRYSVHRRRHWRRHHYWRPYYRHHYRHYYWPYYRRHYYYPYYW